MSENRFCGNCGTSLPTGNKFCGKCGTSVPTDQTISAPQVQPQPVPVQSAPQVQPAPVPGFSPPVNSLVEQIYGVIPNLIRKTGLFSQSSFSAIVTNRRIIFAEMTSEMAKQESRRRYEEGKKKGEGFLSAAFDGMTVGYDFYKRYLDMPAADALKETPGNFAIDLPGLNAVRLSRGALHTQKNTFGGSVNRYDNAKLEMVAAGVKYNFQVLDNNLGITREILGKAGVIVK